MTDRDGACVPDCRIKAREQCCEWRVECIFFANDLYYLFGRGGRTIVLVLIDLNGLIFYKGSCRYFAILER
jgi:hypothetical protein